MSSGVAIAILTYRRPEYLARALKSVLQYRDQAEEILVVDNAAQDSVRQWLRENYPEVRYLAMPYNGGCDGRNLALRTTVAPLLITIDDDVELAGSGAIEVVRRSFARDAALACLNFKVTDKDGNLLAREWCHPRPVSDASTEFETCFILEGACALRRDAVLSAGGYPANFFLGHEGLDLAYRLIDRGQKVAYTPEVSVVHYAAAEQRAGSRTYYYYTRNGIWMAYRFFSLPAALADAIENTAKMFFFAARAGQVRAYLSGCLAGVGEMHNVVRAPLKAATLARLKDIKAHRVSLAGRVRRHLRERIL